MNVEQQHVNDVAVFRVAGAQGIRDAGTLHANVERALHQGHLNVVLNLEKVTDIGAAGLGELVKICSVVRAFKGQLRLSAVPHRVRYLLAVTNLAQLFETVDSEQQAVAAAAMSSTSNRVA